MNYTHEQTKKKGKTSGINRVLFNQVKITFLSYVQMDLKVL